MWMHPWMKRAAVALALIVAWSAPAAAADWHTIRDAHVYTGTPAEIALAFVRAQGDGLGVAPGGWEVERVLPVGDLTTVRLRRTHRGLPVRTSAVIVRVAADKRVTLAVVAASQHLSVSTRPSVTLERALETLAKLPMAPSSPASRGALVVLPDDTGGRLVWEVVTPFRSVQAPGGHAWVDAHTGELVMSRRGGRDVLGRVFAVNPVATPDTEDVELVGLDVSDPQRLSGWEGNLSVVQYNGGSLEALEVEQTLGPNAGEDFLYDPPEDPNDPADAFAQVQTFYHLSRMREHLEGRLGLDTSGPEWKLTAVANLQNGDAPLDNAFFSPQGIGGPFASPNLVGIGQGSLVDFALDSDVVLHEFMHYVSNNAINYNLGQFHTTRYGLSPWSGSIDEGIADYFATSLNDDALMGEASLALFGEGFARDLADPAPRVCPDHLVGEVHADGELIGRFTWSVRVLLGEARADLFVWGALTLLPPGADFGDFAQAIDQTLEAQASTGGITAEEVTAIRDLLAERGLDDCGPELALTPDTPRGATMFGLDTLAQGSGLDCATLKNSGFVDDLALSSLFHFVVTPDPESQGIEINADLTALSDGELEWGIYARAGEAVDLSSRPSPIGIALPVLGAYDHSVEGVTSAGEQTLVISAESEPPFDPEQTYHVVLVHSNCASTQATFTVNAHTPSEVVDEAEPMPDVGGEDASPADDIGVEPDAAGDDVGADAGVADAGPADSGTSTPAPTTGSSDDGCGCQTLAAPSPVRGGWLGLVACAALVCVARRRRATRR